MTSSKQILQGDRPHALAER